jgi:hypothetical protein
VIVDGWTHEFCDGSIRDIFGGVNAENEVTVIFAEYPGSITEGAR